MLSKKDQYKFEHGELEIIDSGYADNKEDYEYYKIYWKGRGAKVVRERTDTKGLINYIVVREVKK